MSNKQKQQIVCVRISEMPKFEDVEFIWCDSCHHVSTNVDWMENNFQCPMKKCNCMFGAAWSQLSSTHEKYPVIPEIGKYYKP